MQDKPHTVYRIYAAHDRLLYIGCTVNLTERMKCHRSKPWGRDIVRVSKESHPSKPAAHKAEREAIRAECPRYNQTSMNPGAFGEGTYDREVKVRNCTVLVGMEHDTGRIKAAFIPHGAKGYDLRLAVERIAKAAAVVARKYPQHDLGVDFSRPTPSACVQGGAL